MFAYGALSRRPCFAIGFEFFRALWRRTVFRDYRKQIAAIRIRKSLLHATGCSPGAYREQTVLRGYAFAEFVFCLARFKTRGKPQIVAYRRAHALAAVGLVALDGGGHATAFIRTASHDLSLVHGGGAGIQKLGGILAPPVPDAAADEQGHAQHGGNNDQQNSGVGRHDEFAV